MNEDKFFGHTMNKNWFTGHTEKCPLCGYPVYFKRPHKIPAPLMAGSIEEAIPDHIDDSCIQTAFCPHCRREIKQWVSN